MTPIEEIDSTGAGFASVPANSDLARKVWRSLTEAVRILYAISFVIPLFNPAVNGTALYFYIWLPFCDLEFLQSLATWKFPLRTFNALSFFVLLFLLALHSWEMSLRAVLLVTQVVYLLFLAKHNLARYLSLSLVAHVAVAIMQVGFFVSTGSVPDYLTPTGITKAIWGASLAPAVFTNFGYELFLPRVSGLHRESGFFSSYIISLYLVLSTVVPLRGRRYLYWLIAAGLCLSFSKITLVVLGILLIKWQQRRVDRIPMWITSALLVGVSMLTARQLFDFLGAEPALSAEGTSISLMHRFFSYYVGQQLEPFNLLFGIYTPLSTHLDMHTQRFATDLYAAVQGLREYNLYAGVGGVLVKGGFVGLLALIFLLQRLRIRSSEFAILFLTTFAVGLDTLQNFVILAWYYVAVQTLHKNALERHEQIAADQSG